MTLPDGRSHCAQILGIDTDADTNAINRAYRQKKYDARNDPEASQRIEAAHSSLMMSALTARMKVSRGPSLARLIIFADMLTHTSMDAGKECRKGCSLCRQRAFVSMETKVSAFGFVNQQTAAAAILPYFNMCYGIMNSRTTCICPMAWTL